MKIENHFVTEMTLEDFADEHGLVMEVHERGGHQSMSLSRFYAHFKSVEVSEGSVLKSAYGNGPTPEKAIANYTPEISERRLVVDAMTEGRKEIQAPRFILDSE